VLVPAVTLHAPTSGRVISIGDGRVLLQPAQGEAVALPVPVSEISEWQPRLRVAPGDEVAAGAVLATTDDELAYQVLMRRFLPAGLFGLMVASFLAAFMSATSSHVNIAGSYLVHDVYRRFLRPGASEAHYMRAARVVTPLVVMAALGIALSSASVKDLFDLFTKLFGGVGLAYILRWTWWRVNAWSEVAVLTSSAAMTLLIALAPGLFLPLLPPGLVAGGKPSFTGGLLLVFAASLLVVVPVTLLTRPVDPEHLAAFVEKVRPPGLWGPIRKPSDWASPGAGWWLRLVICWLGAVLACTGLIFLQGALFLHGGEGAWLWAGLSAAGLLAFLLTLSGSGHRFRAS
jgi:SSS family solute:Na+ symporter